MAASITKFPLLYEDEHCEKFPPVHLAALEANEAFDKEIHVPIVCQKVGCFVTRLPKPTCCNTKCMSFTAREFVRMKFKQKFTHKMRELDCVVEHDTILCMDCAGQVIGGGTPAFLVEKYTIF